jgi:hypothetical protein
MLHRPPKNEKNLAEAKPSYLKIKGWQIGARCYLFYIMVILDEDRLPSVAKIIASTGCGEYHMPNMPISPKPQIGNKKSLEGLSIEIITHQ